MAQAERRALPRVTLAGSLGRGALRDRRSAAAAARCGRSARWRSSLPLFDGGARRANVDAARARYDEAAPPTAATLRGAVREVEEALVALQSTADRGADAQHRRRRLRRLVPRHRGALPRRPRPACSNWRTRAAARCRRADRADRPAARTRRRLDLAVPRARRRLVRPPTRRRCRRGTAADDPMNTAPTNPAHHCRRRCRRRRWPSLAVARDRQRSPAPAPCGRRQEGRRGRARAGADRHRHPAAAHRRCRCASAPTATSPPGRRPASAPRPTACAWPTCGSTSATWSSAARCSPPSRPTRCRPTLAQSRAAVAEAEATLAEAARQRAARARACRPPAR